MFAAIARRLRVPKWVWPFGGAVFLLVVLGVGVSAGVEQYTAGRNPVPPTVNMIVQSLIAALGIGTGGTAISYALRKKPPKDEAGSTPGDESKS